MPATILLGQLSSLTTKLVTIGTNITGGKGTTVQHSVDVHLSLERHVIFAGFASIALVSVEQLNGKPAFEVAHVFGATVQHSVEVHPLV